MAEYGFPDGQEPRGIWPLLIPGRWLVSGTGGLGVQVVSHEGNTPTATPVGDFADVEPQYISHVCLPFDPRGN